MRTRTRTWRDCRVASHMPANVLSRCVQRRGAPRGGTRPPRPVLTSCTNFNTGCKSTNGSTAGWVPIVNCPARTSATICGAAARLRYATPQTAGHMTVTLRRTCSAIANPKPPTLAAVTLFKKHVLGLYWQHSMPNTTRGADGRASGVFAALAGWPAGVAATRALSSDSATFTATPPRESPRRRRPGRARSNCARASKNCSSLNVRDTRLCRPPATAPHTPRHKRHGIQRELERATQRKGHEHAPTTLRPCTPRVQTQHTWRTQCGRRGLSTLTAPPAQHDTHISMTKPRANRTPCRSGPLWPWNTRSLRASKLSDEVDVNDSRRQALTQSHTGVSRRQTHLADTTVPPVAGNSAITDMSSHMSTFAL